LSETAYESRRIELLGDRLTRDIATCVRGDEVDLM